MNLQYQRFPYPPGMAGIEKTVQYMRGLVSAGVKDPYVRALAVRVLKDYAVKPLDVVGEVRAVYEWVKQNIRYTKDPVSQELLQSAKRTLDFRVGDCDDFSILLSALLGAIGHATRLRVVGQSSQNYSHVYPEVQIRGQWVSLDATSDKIKFGEHPIFSTQKTYDLGEPMLAQDVVNPEAVETLNISGNDVYREVAQAVVDDLNQQFSAGTLTPGHLALYLESVPKELNMTPLMKEAALKAVELVGMYRFGMTPERLRQQMPAPGQLGDLSGFLSGLWKAAKKAVGIVIGGAKKLLGVDPTKPIVVKIETPVSTPVPIDLGNNVKAQVVPTGTAFDVMKFITSPLGLGAIGFLVFALTGGFKKSRRR